MSVEQSGHQPWLYEPGTPDPLSEPEFDTLGEHSLITPPVEPAVAAPDYEGQHHTPSWAHEPYTEVPEFTAPIQTLEPEFGEPLYAQLFAETHPDAVASQMARPSHKQMATGYQVMSLQDRGPLVREGESGSIFDTLNKERSTSHTNYYAELRRPYYGRPPTFEQMTATSELAPAPVRREITMPPKAEVAREITVVTPVEAIAPETPRTVITVKGEQEGSVAAIIEEEQSGLDKQEAATFLTRVLRGLEKSRDADLAAEAAKAAQVAKAEAETEAYAEQAAREAQAKTEAERLAAEAELARDVAIIEAATPQEPVETEMPHTVEHTPTVVREEHLTLSGIRAAAKEVIANHKRATRIAEYAGVAVVAVAAGARLLGRFRRR